MGKRGFRNLGCASHRAGIMEMQLKCIRFKLMRIRGVHRAKNWVDRSSELRLSTGSGTKGPAAVEILSKHNIMQLRKKST